VRREAAGAVDADARPPPGRSAGRAVLAGVVALVLGLALVNLLAARLLSEAGGVGGVLLVCAIGPLVEEACKFGAFVAVARPARRGWSGYWVLGLVFGVAEALLKLGRFLTPETAWREDAAAAAALLAGALASLALHTALGVVVARVTGRRGLAAACAAHVAFNTLTLGAIFGLSSVWGEAGAQLGLGLSATLALALLGVTWRAPARGGDGAPTEGTRRA